MFFIYSESHLIERTNLSETPNGHWCGFRTKATGASRSPHTSVDGSWEAELCLRAPPLRADAGQLDPKVTFLESIKLGTPVCWR